MNFLKFGPLFFCATLAGTSLFADVPASSTASGETASAGTLALIAQSVRRAPNFAGKFSQTKRLLDLDVELKSAGEFVFSRERGLVWQTQKPLKSTVLLDAETVSFFDKNGVCTQKIALNENAAAEEIFQIVSKILAGEFESVSALFLTQISGSQSAWTLELAPPRERANTFPFAKISVRGNADFIEEITLDSPRDNERTTLRFSDVRPLSAQEARASALFPATKK